MATILVVDDDDGHRTFVADLLRLEGHDVTEAKSCAQALQELAQQSFDLITLDHLMPEMTGLECYERINPRGTRVIFVSVYGNSPIFEPLRREGVSILKKPFSPDELVKMVDRSLAQTPTGR